MTAERSSSQVRSNTYDRYRVQRAVAKQAVNVAIIMVNCQWGERFELISRGIKICFGERLSV